MENDSRQVITEKIFDFFATKMPKLPHSEPLTAELSGAVDSGTQPSIAGSKNSLRILLDRTSRLFYTYSTCKNVTVYPRHSQYNRMHAPRTFYCHESRLAAERRIL